MTASDELLLEVTLRRDQQRPWRLRVFQGFPVDFAAAHPLPGFEDADFPVTEWLDEQSTHRTIQAVKSLLAERRYGPVRLCYDPVLLYAADDRDRRRVTYLGRLPLEEVFARRFGVSLVRHPLDGSGALATPYAQEVAVPGKLKVLLLYANPGPQRFTHNGPLPHLPHLKDHFLALRQALTGLEHQQIVFFETLTNERGDLTAAQIEERVKAFNPQVLLYLGHGYSGSNIGNDLFKFGNGLFWGDRPEEKLPYRALRQTLAGMKTSGNDPALRLLMLIACYSATAGPQIQTPGAEEGEATRAVQVPAVVAMNGEYPADAVTAFGAGFFGALCERRSVEECFHAALDALRADFAPQRVHELPRLWLTAAHSRLFPSPEESALGLYQEQVKGVFGHVPLHNRNTTVPLNDLYVERVVVERAEQRPPGSGVAPMTPTAGYGAAPSEKQVQEKVRELRQELERHHRVLLSADAFTGKSTLCQDLILNADGQEPFSLPILIRFSDFAASRKGGRQRSLRAYLQEDHAGFLGLDRLSVLMGTGETAREIPLGEWLYLQWEAGKALLIVDGLDEVFDDARRTNALAAIPRTWAKEQQPRVLFTSRPFGNLLVPDAFVLHLKEFDKDAQIRECVGNCERLLAGFGSRLPDETQVTRFLAALGEDARRKDLARRPGHLVLMYVQFRATGMMALFEEDLMAWVAQERFQVTDTDRAEPRLSPNESDDRQQIMEAVCFHMLFCRKATTLPRAEVLALVHSAKIDTQFADVPQTFILNDLVRNSGFLRETETRDGQNAIALESVPWLQFFAAGYLARKFDAPRLNNKGEMLALALQNWVSGSSFTCSICATPLPDFAHFLWRREWRDVVLLLAGQMEDATPLLERIQQEPKDMHHQMLSLSGHVLRRAARVDPGLARRICEQLKQGVFSVETASCEAVTRCLGRSKHDANLAPFRVFLQANLKKRIVGRDAAEALGKIGDASAVQALLEQLKDREVGWYWRRSVAEALGKIGDTSVVPALLEQLKDLNLHGSVVRALGTLGERCNFRVLSSGQVEDLP